MVHPILNWMVLCESFVFRADEHMLMGFFISRITQNSASSSDAPLNFNLASGLHQFVVFVVTTLFVMV